MQLAHHPDALTRLPLVVNIDFAGRIIADEHSRQTRHNAGGFLEFAGALGNLRLQSRCQCFAIQQPCSHVHRSLEKSLSTSIEMPSRALWRRVMIVDEPANNHNNGTKLSND